MNAMRFSKSRAFTLVEIMVVVVVISILASMIIVGYSSVQKDTRDSARSSKSTVIAEALERYYNKNNEYPSVASLAGQSIATIKTKLSIKDDDVLIFPKGAANVSAFTTTTPSATALLYAGTTRDTSAPVASQCQSDVNGYCDTYKMQYMTEKTGTVVTLNSRQNADLVVTGGCSGSCLAAPTKPTVVGTQSGGNIIFTASAATCASGTVEYKIRYSTVSAGSLPAWSTVSWSAATTKTIAQGANTTFYSSAQAQCVSGVDAGPSSVDSDVHTLTIPSPPSAPVVSASPVSSSSIQVSWSASTGTAPITYSVAGAGNASSCTSSPCNVTGLAASTSYTFTVTATNSIGSANGSASATTPSSGVAPSAPSPSAFAVSSSSIQVSWGASSGTATISYSVSGAGTATSCSSSPCTVTGLAASTSYTFTVTAANGYGSANGSASATTSAPAPPTCSQAPSQPVVSSAAGTATSGLASWSASSTPANCSAPTYTVTYGVATSYGSAACSGTSSTACAGMTGLASDTLYSVKVTPSNSFGAGTPGLSNFSTSPYLIASAGAPGNHGVTNVSWSYSLSGYTAPTSLKFNITGITSSCTNLASTVRSCSIDNDPCSVAHNGLWLTDTPGRDDSFNIAAFTGAKPSISNPGTSSVSGSNIIVRWTNVNTIGWIQMRKSKDGGAWTYIDNIQENSSPYTLGPLGSGNWTVEVAASDCHYRATWATPAGTAGGNYLPSDTITVGPKTIP